MPEHPGKRQNGRPVARLPADGGTAVAFRPTRPRALPAGGPVSESFASKRFGKTVWLTNHAIESMAKRRL
jgi:hypothetical protein